MRRLLVLPVAAALLAACSGGGADPEVKNAYVKQAEMVCEKADAAKNAIKSPTGTADFAPYVRALVNLASSSEKELSALTPPAEDKADIEAKLLVPLRKQVEVAMTYATDVEAATKKNDQAALVRLAGNAPLKNDVDLNYLKSYGFNSCYRLADPSS